MPDSSSLTLSKAWQPQWVYLDVYQLLGWFRTKTIFVGLHSLGWGIGFCSCHTPPSLARSTLLSTLPLPSFASSPPFPCPEKPPQEAMEILTTGCFFWRPADIESQHWWAIASLLAPCIVHWALLYVIGGAARRLPVLPQHWVGLPTEFGAANTEQEQLGNPWGPPCQTFILSVTFVGNFVCNLYQSVTDTATAVQACCLALFYVHSVAAVVRQEKAVHKLDWLVD